MRLPGFSSSAPAQPAAAAKGPDLEAQRKAKESIASRNQGSARRAAFTKKQRGALLLKERDEADTLA